MKRYNIFVVFFSALLLFSCKHDPAVVPEIPVIPPVTVDCDPDTAYFQQQVLPLLVSSCGVAGCHDPGTASDGIVLTDYASVIASGKVRAGNPGESDLLEVLTEDDPEDRMPPSPRQPLTAQQIATISQWIRQGAKNNSCESGSCDTTNVSFSNHVWPVIQTSCLGCHSGGSPSGGIGLANHSQVAQAAATGRLLGAVRWESGFAAMPQNGNQLSACQITQIKKWIENGTPNN